MELASFSLQIFLVGLVALVPDGPNLTVVVPVRSGHTPVVVFPCADAASCAGNTRALAEKLAITVNLDTSDNLLRATNETCVTGQALKELEGVRLSIRKLKPGILQFVGGKHGRLGDMLGGLPLTSIEGKDFSWVAAMARIRNAPCHLQDEYFTPKPGEVAAVLSLEGVKGDVQTAGLVAYREDSLHGCVAPGALPSLPGGDIVPFVRSLTFRRNSALFGRSPRQAFADVVEVEVRVEGDHGELVLEKVDGQGRVGRETIELKPRRAGPPQVAIAIANLTPMNETATSCTDARHHFDIYHDMARENLDPNRRKVPFLGLDMRRVRFSEIYHQPAAVKVVTVKRNEADGGGEHRPICMLAAYSPGKPAARKPERAEAPR